MKQANLTLSVPDTEIAEFANSVGLDNEPLHLDLHIWFKLKLILSEYLLKYKPYKSNFELSSK